MEVIFYNPFMLLLLLFVPLLVILHFYFFQHNKKRAMKFSNFAAMKHVTGTKLITKNTYQLVIRLAIVVFMILAFSQPTVWYESDVSITDYVIAIDSSASMVSQDVLPNRLEVSKQAASTFLSRLDAKTNIGLLSFSGVSYIKSPMTTDIQAVRTKISEIDIELSGGTDIGAALITATNMLMPTDKTKAVVLITDGSDTAGIFVEESIETALNYVRENSILVHTIAIGSGQANAGYLTEINLPATYDRDTLQFISETTGGSYYEVKSTAEIATAFSDIENQNEKGRDKFEVFNLFFIIGFILLLIEWVLLNTRFRSIP